MIETVKITSSEHITVMFEHFSDMVSKNEYGLPITYVVRDLAILMRANQALKVLQHPSLTTFRCRDL